MPDYHASIYLDDSPPVTSPVTTVAEITATSLPPSPVFEMTEPAVFVVEVVGPKKPYKVALVHRGWYSLIFC